MSRTLLNQAQHLPILICRSIPAQRHFDLAQDGGQGSTELMRRIARKRSLPLERHLQSIQQIVECPI